MTDLTSMRISYTRSVLRRSDLLADPLAQFQKWFEQALATDLPEPYAMSVATADAVGRPSVRTVLLRGVDEQGLVFYTNYDSHKGRDLASNAKAELLFYWAELEQQVRAFGTVERVSEAEAEAYFHKRPYQSQLAAHASDPQSAPIVNREVLEEKFAELGARYPKGQEVPKPDFWGGYRVKVQEWEFWQGRPNRMHDRFLYSVKDGGWDLERLMP